MALVKKCSLPVSFNYNGTLYNMSNLSSYKLVQIDALTKIVVVLMKPTTETTSELDLFTFNSTTGAFITGLKLQTTTPINVPKDFTITKSGLNDHSIAIVTLGGRIVSFTFASSTLTTIVATPSTNLSSVEFGTEGITEGLLYRPERMKVLNVSGQDRYVIANTGRRCVSIFELDGTFVNDYILDAGSTAFISDVELIGTTLTAVDKSGNIMTWEIGSLDSPTIQPITVFTDTDFTRPSRLQKVGSNLFFSQNDGQTGIYRIPAAGPYTPVVFKLLGGVIALGDLNIPVYVPPSTGFEYTAPIANIETDGVDTVIYNAVDNTLDIIFDDEYVVETPVVPPAGLFESTYILDVPGSATSMTAIDISAIPELTAMAFPRLSDDYPNQSNWEAGTAAYQVWYAGTSLAPLAEADWIRARFEGTTYGSQVTIDAASYGYELIDGTFNTAIGRPVSNTRWAFVKMN